jgi:hypothetical protein
VSAPREAYSSGMSSAADLGRRLVALRAAIVGALKPHPPEPVGVDVVPDGVHVGVCGSCGGDVLYDRASRSARCPCGDTRIPRAFIAWNVAAAGKPRPR